MNLSFECCSSSSDIRVRTRRAKDAVGQAESSTAATWAFQSVCKHGETRSTGEHVQETQKLLSYPGTNWQDCSSAVDELATAVEAIGPSTSRKDAARLLLSLSVSIGTQLASLRSRLVKDTCECLLRIVKVMERDFQDMANALLPQVIGTAKSALAAIRQPGSKLMCKMSEVVRYDLSLLKKIYMPLMQDKARVLVLEQLGIIFVYWSDNEVLPFESDVLDIIRGGLEDQHEKVRKTAREVLTRFSTRWSERVDELVDIPSSQSKALLVSEHRDSPLAEAILKEYPELSNTLSRSRSSFTQSRTSSRKSPRHQREQHIEIHVSKTPPPKRREQQEVTIPETNSVEATTSTSTRRTASSPESTAREKSAASRRLFDNPDVSFGGDDDQQDDALEAFDGSQMHTTTKSQTVQPLAPEIGNTPSPPPAIPSRARSSSTSSIEGASLRHSGVRKLQETKVPSPLSRSPSLLSQKRLESPSSSTSSPKLRPSLLPRPGSFTLKARGSSGPSTPVGSAKFEEADVNPLSASDEYFSKPIPSSIATPTPPPPSTDNVTLRSRRRVFVHQDQEDSPLQIYAPELSSPELPTSEEFVRPQQVETPVSIVCKSSEDQKTPPPLHEPLYAGYTDEADDIGHLTEGSDHIESDTEWNHRRLDYSGHAGSEEEEDQQKSSFVAKSDTFPDEWHLDDGPRHKFELEDEIGSRLSDDDQDPVEFVGAVEDEQKPLMNEPEMSQTVSLENVESSRQEYFTVQTDYEEEEDDDEHEELITENTPNDALTGLLNVRAEMTRLREVTRNEETRYDVPFSGRQEPSTRYTVNTADAADESKESLPVTSTVPWEDPTTKKPSYLERLTHADHSARSPLIAPPADAPRGENERGDFMKQLSPLQAFEPAFNEEHEQLEDKDFLALQAQSPSPPPIFERATAKNDETKTGSVDFAKASQIVENYSLQAEPSAGLQESQHQEPFIAHDDQAGRFDAAEKLFAAKEVLDFYDRPQSPHERYVAPQLPEQGRCMQSQPRYPAPTRMGAKLAPTFERNVVTEAKLVSAFEQNVAVEDVDDALKVAPAESMIETDDADERALEMMKTLPTWADERALEQAVEETLPPAYQPVPSFVESMLPATTAKNKHDIDKTPMNAVPERNPPPAKLSWIYSFGISLVMLLSAIFCIAGLLHAAKKVNESHEYHLDLKARIGRFESSIAESHKKVLKLEKDYAIWSEYVRKLTEEDEANALMQLQALHVEVQKWQQDMHEDLVQFRQALSVDSIEEAFANLRVNDTKQIEE
ncbi:hypothetical protein JG688_00005230 [Phytophthora aleatoria]|uniref:CLASP N-terminal domain-containing protein n=1 Tax=Phytophthora aleatoria TaxID=2496075 RepID=A0A8J5J000_9STRA|nr:hypothetical protein JG688_00005230 [Phytophthora aleatoria]